MNDRDTRTRNVTHPPPAPLAGRAARTARPLAAPCRTFALAALGALPALLSLAALLSLPAPPAAAASSARSEAAVEAAERALEHRRRFPWYDASNEQLRKVPVEPQEELAQHRDSQWQWSVPEPAATGDAWSRIWAIVMRGLQLGAWTILALLLAGIALLLFRTFLYRATDGSGGPFEEDDGLGDVERVEMLPFRVQAPTADLLGEAQRRYESGDYDGAMVYLYSYQLVELDKHHRIRLARGKTNRQYLRELKQERELAAIIESSMIDFEEVFFGRHRIGRQRFESHWNQLDRFRQRLARSLDDSAVGAAPTAVVQALALALLATALGCGRQELATDYGQRSSARGSASVNGTGVLAEMFQGAGHSVSTMRRLSPRLEQHDTIVWFARQFTPPTDQQREFLEQWLAGGYGRTLIYVGRDFDAEPRYWETVLAQAEPQEVREIQRRMALARSDHDRRRMRMPEDESVGWFRAQRGGLLRTATHVSSHDSNWLDGLDPAQLQIQLQGRLALPEPGGRSAAWRYQQLLQADDDPLVVRATDVSWSNSQLLVVVNGSFLLNLPLTNRQHRRLAARLIDQCGRPGSVVFLEEPAAGLPVYSQEPDEEFPSGLTLLKMWPQGLFWLHLIAIGILFCFAVFPILGPPRRLPPAETSDFGKHVEALGALLERTRDRPYAVERLRHYQQMREGAAAEPARAAVPPKDSSEGSD